MQKLDNLESSDHLKMAFAPAQPDFVPFDVAERRKKNIQNETGGEMKRQESHYSFALCHSDDSLSAAPLSSPPKLRNVVMERSFLCKFLPSAPSPTWENCTHYKWLSHSFPICRCHQLAGSSLGFEYFSFLLAPDRR